MELRESRERFHTEATPCVCSVVRVQRRSECDCIVHTIGAQYFRSGKKSDRKKVQNSCVDCMFMQDWNGFHFCFGIFMFSQC